MASGTTDKSAMFTSTPYHAKVTITKDETPCSLHFAGKSNRSDDSGYFSPSPNVASKSSSTQLESSLKSLLDSYQGLVPQTIGQKSSRTQNNDLKQSTVTLHSLKTVGNPSDSTTAPLPKLPQQFDRLYATQQNIGQCCVCQSAQCQRNCHIPGSFVNVNHVDYLSQFDSLNMKIVLSQILKQVTDRDLCSISCVSKKWRCICLKDQLANNRRKSHLERTKMEKENNRMSVLSTKGRARKHSVQKLDDIQNICFNENLAEERRQEPKSQSEQRFQRFVEEGQRLRSNERLDKCPRCSSPARVNTALKRAKCSLSGCEFDYCIQCRCEYCIPHKCSPLRVGSRRNLSTSKKNAKRNLRRLLS